ncbi:UBC-like protein [Choiromyces venosus 120613-1]|uniref:UBC-like protein n=1 Tax=Choiromyces venosus 120613-1 TaxID=1336337 RepID=A0A3N4JHD3_9PEZI|nr:UBC-like protein [Choiromyces venosus 120613-1]
MSSASHRRRLAQDHSALRTALPADYFFPPNTTTDDLTNLQINLCGPTQTPFETGLFQIHMRIPTTYPAEPPKASFKTKIFHPNVDERSGDVCVDTLKRDWKPTLTLKDVLVTIRCLLVYPNPTSSLNEAAGKLLLEDYEGYARHARLMTGVHAGVPEELKELVEEARCRGEDQDQGGKVVVAGKKTKYSKAPAEHNRKIKQAVKPSAATATVRKDKGKEKEKEKCSDSEGGDSGKENAETRRFVARPVSPLGKHSMDEAAEESCSGGIEKAEDTEDSGRKSPKLREGQSANSRSPLTTTTTTTTTSKKEIITTKKDSTKKSTTITTATTSGKSSKTGSAAARKVGLKRF